MSHSQVIAVFEARSAVEAGGGDIPIVATGLEAVFDASLQYVIGLTQGRHIQLNSWGGITNVDDLLLVDLDTMISNLQDMQAVARPNAM